MANQGAKDRVRRVASRQFGRIAWRQLRELGMAGRVINKWVNEGYLDRKLPGVSAVGHDAPSFEAGMAAAVFYAGPDAMLSHGTAMWWFGLTEHPPPSIH